MTVAFRRPNFKAELVVHHRALANKAEAVYGRNCPCCNVRFAASRITRRHAQQAPDMRTVAHVMPEFRGGDERRWVFTCYRCNHDQGNLSFEEWGRYLAARDDPRAGLVALFNSFLRDWLAEAEDRT